MDAGDLLAVHDKNNGNYGTNMANKKNSRLSCLKVAQNVLQSYHHVKLGCVSVGMVCYQRC